MIPSPNLGLGLHGERYPKGAARAHTHAHLPSLALASRSLCVSMRKAGLGPTSVSDKRTRGGLWEPREPRCRSSRAQTPGTWG